MKAKTLLVAITASLIGLATPLRAEDIDLYTGGESFTGASSNVLIFLDNSANWSNSNPGMGMTQGAAELAALKTVIDTLPSSVNIAVMMHAKTGNDTAAYVRFAMRPMTDANRTRLKEVFDDIVAAGPTSSVEKIAQSADGDKAIEQIYRYFNGLHLQQTNSSFIYPIPRDSKEDYSSNTVYAYSKSHPSTIGGLGSYGYNAAPNPSSGSTMFALSSDRYARPAEVNGGCAKNYVIWIGNTNIDGDTSTAYQDRLIGSAVETAAANSNVTMTVLTSQITTYHSAGNDGQAPEGKMIDEWARFMKSFGVPARDSSGNLITRSGAQVWDNIVTYTVDVFQSASGNAPAKCITTDSTPATTVPQHYIMQSVANAGGGKCFPASNTAQLAQALQQIFAEIQAVNSVFASATLPISVNTQGTFENQVYIGVFRPDQYARQRWYGNLKEYQFARYCDVNTNDLVDDVGGPNDERIDRESGNTGTVPTCTGDTLKLFLADRNNKPAIDQTLTTGFIALDATSLWTQDTSFWAFNPNQTSNNSGASDMADGPNVERGGAAYRARTMFPLQTASSGTADIDHRNVYTCLSSNCINGTSTQKVLSNNLFNTSNATLTTALTSSWPKVASLSRTAGSGTVTVTTTKNGADSAHGLSVGDQAIISGTGQAAYDTTVTVASVPVTASMNTFTFTVTETPTSDTSGSAYISIGGAAPVSKTIASIVANAAGTVATVTTTASHGFAATDNITIQGAKESTFNTTLTGTAPSQITSTSATTFTYPISWTAPATPATTAGSTQINFSDNAASAGTQTNASVKRLDTTNFPRRVTVVWGADLPLSGNASAKVAAGSRVVVSGATPTAYNGTFTVVATDANCPGTGALSGKSADPNAIRTFCYDLLPNDTGDGVSTFQAIQAGAGSTTVYLDLNRSGSTVTATRHSGATALPTSGSVTIYGSTQSVYNAAQTILTGDGNTFTFSVTTSPSTSASGSATISGAPTMTAANLINWMRGVDNHEDENADNLTSASALYMKDVRASIQGDVLHARPVLVNYGGSLGIVGFFGSNDGYLRSFKGGTADTDGGEYWAFIPDEFVNLTKLARMYDNTPLVRLPNSSCSASPSPRARDYYWDGQLTVYQSPEVVWYRTDPATTTTTKPTDCSTSSPCYSRPAKTYLFAGMRRGGQAIYALDVSVPTAPSLLWRINPSSSGFTNLGYTWSEPKVSKVKFTNADASVTTYDVLVFGGGYDPTDDDQPAGCPRGDHPTAALSTSGGTGGATCPNAGGTYSGIGRGVYVVNLLNGQPIHHFTAPSPASLYSFPADVTVLDMDGDGYLDRIYAGDSGGQLFRFDINSSLPADDANQFKSYYLANMGDKTSVSDMTPDGGTDARKILFPPEVLPMAYKKLDGTSVAAVMVLVGTGDREKPLPNVDSSGNINSVTCGSLYNSTYFGRRVRDRFYAHVDRIAANGTIDGDGSTAPTLAVDGDMPDPTSGSSYKAIVTSTNSTSTADNAVTPFNICYAFEANCVSGQTNTIYSGWYLNLKNVVGSTNTRDEEKLVNAPKVVSGLLLFGTSTPKSPDPDHAVCSNLGEARSYAINPFSGEPSFNRDSSTDGSGNATLTYKDYSATVTGGGLPPTVTAGVVSIDGEFYRFLIGAGGSGVVSASPIAGAKNPITLKGTRSRVFWYYPADDK